jgi:hypothetical protein
MFPSCSHFARAQPDLELVDIDTGGKIEHKVLVHGNRIARLDEHLLRSAAAIAEEDDDGTYICASGMYRDDVAFRVRVLMLNEVTAEHAAIALTDTQ